MTKDKPFEGDDLDFLNYLKTLADDLAQIDGIDPSIKSMLEDQIDLTKAQSAFDADIEKALADGHEDHAMELIQKKSAALRAAMPEGFEPEVYPAPYDMLHEAIEDGDLTAIDLLLANGIDLNGFTNKYGSRPLIWAMMAENRSPQMIEALIAGGADAAYATLEGYTALHYIADTNIPDQTVDIPTKIAAVLIANGCDLEARTHWGWTPLYRAIFEGTAIEAEALLRNGADANAAPVDVDAPACAKTQPLLLAAGMQTDKVRLLLEYGADAQAVLEAFEAAALDAEHARAERRAAGTIGSVRRHVCRWLCRLAGAHSHGGPAAALISRCVEQRCR